MTWNMKASTLGDGSKVYRVIALDRDNLCETVIECEDEKTALNMCAYLNKHTYDHRVQN